MSLKNCHNFEDFRKLAKKKLPSPIFHYIDGGADDESTLRRNTESFNDCDLIPNILASVGKPDLSTTLFGKKLICQFFFLLLRCRDYIIQKETELQHELLKSLIHFIVCHLWEIIL